MSSESHSGHSSPKAASIRSFRSFDGEGIRRYPASICSQESRGHRSIRSTIESWNRSKASGTGLDIAQEQILNFPAEFTSRRLKPGAEATIEKTPKDRRQKIIGIIPVVGIVIGILLGAYMVFNGYQSVPKHKFCLILDEDWSNGIDPATWTHEVQVGGFGNGEFDWTTTDASNAYTENGVLHIVPTLTEDFLSRDQVLNGYNLNLTADGTCTSPRLSDCVAVSNSTIDTIINPVRSARLITKDKFTMKYGKLEVRAKMPRGDWLWPAIWMMPQHSVYGEWPRSGEIDIAESRGNYITYPGGRNVVSSSLHWGPQHNLDKFYKTSNANVAEHAEYSDEFVTFGLEWTDKYLYTYINSHLRQVLYVKFDQPFFKRGQYPTVDATNKTSIDNPWTGNVAPFDQEFFLILNVAVGSTNGYFPEGKAEKPWSDESETPLLDFYKAKDTWYPTWPTDPAERGMSVESVKAWKLCD